MLKQFFFLAVFLFCVSFAIRPPILATPAHELKEGTKEHFTIIQKPAMTILGIACRTSNAPDQGTQDIPKLWGKFYGEDIMNQIPHKISNDVIALYCDYEGDHTQPYTLIIGCEVSAIDHTPSGMVAKTIPSGNYAVFKAMGEHPQSLIETWGHIWQLTHLQRTYTGDYELYGDRFFLNSPKEVDVCIAIENE